MDVSQVMTAILTFLPLFWR